MKKPTSASEAESSPDNSFGYLIRNSTFAIVIHELSMRYYHLTHIGALLVEKKLLENRLNIACITEKRVRNYLNDLYQLGVAEWKETLSQSFIEKLTNLRILNYLDLSEPVTNEITAYYKNNYHNNPLKHLEQIHFEITYHCNSKCPHCVLKSVRNHFLNQQLDFKEIKQTISDAYFAGIIDEGIAFTGGEALLTKTDIFELIRFASSFGIHTKLFTNTFWGNKWFFKAAGKVFLQPDQLVKNLKRAGLKVLAITFDSRVDKDKVGIKQLENVILACEEQKLRYELYFSNEHKSTLESFITDLKKKNPEQSFRYYQATNMQLVDMGGASTLYNTESKKISFSELIQKSDCAAKSFVKPSILSISPEGGIRMCMFGLGLNHAGNIRKNDFFSILNIIEQNPVCEVFAKKQTEEYIEKLYQPFRHVYKPFAHPCTATVILARLIQDYHLNGKDDTAEGLLVLNQNVAKDLNLLA